MELQEKMEARLFNRNKWAYSLGGIGRDMTYTLVALFLMNYIQFSGLGLSVAQFSTIGVILIIGRVWDAINDPMMGAIIENTKTKWGKFKPWIFIGAVLTGLVIIVMFSIRPTGNEGWNYVIFFAVLYFLWEITFTMNDISYWSMLPALAKDPNRRNKVTTLAVVFAGVGSFIAYGGINQLTIGNAVQGYRNVAIIIAIALILCQSLTVFGVKQPNIEVNEEHVSFEKMFKVIKNNDQLLWNILAMLLYNIGSNLLVALGNNYIYIELGYNSFYALVFSITFAISQVGIQIFYTKLVNKFGRNNLLKYSFISLAFGYILMLTLGFNFLSISIPINIYTIVLFGIFVFSGQSIFYMVLTVNIANTVEYNEYKTKERNESVIFSLRPFMAKMASAIEQGFIILVLTTSGILILSNNIGMLEKQKNLFDQMSISEQAEYKQNIIDRKIIFDNEDFNDMNEEEIQNTKNKYFDILNELLESDGFVKNKNNDKETMVITEVANQNFKDIATPKMRVFLRISITLVPAILVFLSYIVLKKKFIIDENYYDKMLLEIKSRTIS